MADEKITTILQVELDAGKVAQDLQDLITRIAALKAQQKELNDQIKAGNDIDGKYAEQLIRVKDQLAWTEKQAKGLSATTKLLNADTLTYSDSLNGERQKLADMQKAYDQLDASFRESEGGKAFLEAIKAQSDAVKGLEEDTGRAQRNVGNYPKAWEDAIPGFNKANAVLSKIGISMDDLRSKGAKAFSGLGQSVKAFGKAFITPPIVIITAVLGAIMAIVNKVSEAFKKNDNAMTALQKAFAVFKPIGEAVGKVFNAVADGLAKVATAAADAVGWIAGKLSPAYKQAADDAQKLVERQDKLEESERNATVNAAARNAKIAQLRDKAAQSEKYSVEERKKALEDAIKLEQKNLEEAKIIARERLKILEAEAKQNIDTSDEMQNKIAQARAAMYAAEQSYYSGVRELNGQLTAFDKEEKAKQQQKVQEAKQRAKEKEQAEKEYEDFRIKIRRETEDALAGMEKDATKREIQAAKTAGERTVEDLRVKLSRLKNTDLEARKALEDLIVAVEKETQEKVTEIQIKAEDERNSLRRETGRKKAEMGVKDELKLAQMRYDAAQEDYARLQQLTDEQIEALYETQEQYQAALTDAEIEAYNAREQLENEEFEKEKERTQLILELKIRSAEKGSETWLELQKEKLELQKKLLEKQMEQELDQLGLSEEEKKLIRDKYRDGQKKLDDDFANWRKKTDGEIFDDQIEGFKRVAQAASVTFSALSSMLKEYGKENEAAQKAAKAFGVMKIISDQAVSIADTAKSISTAVAGATEAAASTGPAAPFVLAGYIAGMVGAVVGAIASVASSFVQAKQLIEGADAGNYATGGVVGGSSYSGDKLIAHVNSGEGIYTGTQANNLLQEIANNPARGGFDIEAYAQATAAAVAAQPAPVVVYSEMQEFGQKVSTYNEIARI